MRIVAEFARGDTQTRHKMMFQDSILLCLGNNDADPFRLPGFGAVTTETELTGDSIFKYCQAFDSLTRKAHRTQLKFKEQPACSAVSVDKRMNPFEK